MIISLLISNLFDFAVYLICAFVFFSTSLLFWDSYKLKSSGKTLLIRGLGFFLLSIVYLYYASTLNAPTSNLLIQIIKIVSLALIFVSILIEPLLRKPQNNLAASLWPLSLPLLSQSLIPVSALLFLIIFFWYWRRSTIGMDKQLKPISIAFFFFSISEFLKISFVFANTSQVFWSKILATHSLVWNIHLAFLLIGIVILSFWVWGYIRFRLKIQLFSTILASTLFIFLFTTSIFSLILTKNLENDALSHLKTDVRVFQYSLDRLQLEALAHARAIAADTNLRKAIINNNQPTISTIASETLITQNLSSVIILNSDKEVLARGENEDNFQDRLSDDQLLSSALVGQPLSTIVADQHPVNPAINIRSSVPIYDENFQKIIGAVITAFAIDDAFVDGIKAVTKLDATVFVANQRVATTLIAPDGKSRNIGTLQTDKMVLDEVLGKGKTYVNTVEVLNEPYYGAYCPLKTLNDKTVGMLFIGKPQVELVNTAQNSINSTFTGSIILIIFSLIPVYFISKFIEENLKA